MRVHFPAGVSGLSLLQSVRTSCGPHPNSYAMSTRESLPGDKANKAWNWTLVPSSAEVANEWSCTYTAPYMPSWQAQKQTDFYTVQLYQVIVWNCPNSAHYVMGLECSYKIKHTPTCSVVATSITCEITIHKLISQAPFTRAAFWFMKCTFPEDGSDRQRDMIEHRSFAVHW